MIHNTKKEKVVSYFFEILICDRYNIKVKYLFSFDS